MKQRKRHRRVESSREKGDEVGEMQGGGERENTELQRNSQQNRREVSTGPCSSFCIEISFIICFCNVKNAPLPQDVLCFSGHVAVSPLPPQRAATLTARTEGCIYRQGGGEDGDSTVPGGAGRRGRDMYTERFASTAHTVFLQSSLLGFCFVRFCRDYHIK